MRLLATGPVALLVTLTLAACTTERADPDRTPDASAPSTSAPSPGSATPSPSSSAEPPSIEPSSSFTLALAGDVHFEGALRDRLDDPATALAPVTEALSAADLTVVNLETSVGSGGRPEPGKRFTFQAPPTAYAALAAAGVDIVSMANNHALDYGRAPLPGTFAAIERARTAAPPLRVVGLGRDAAEAFAPAVVDVDGTAVAVIGTTVAGADPTADPTGQWAATSTSAGTADALDPARLLRTVRRADRSADVVVVYAHWGIQGRRCPSADQRELAADLAEAGADIVVGSHAHVLQGDGRLRARGRDAFIAYGLGNFAWYTQDPATAATGVLTLTIEPPVAPTGRASVRRAAWLPLQIGSDGLPRGLPAHDRPAFEADRTGLRTCAGLGRLGSRS